MRKFQSILFAVFIMYPICFGLAETLGEADELVIDQDYTRALDAIEQILADHPDNDEAYMLKLRLRLMALKDSYRALNDMLGKDIERVKDRYAYTNLASSLYEEAGLKLAIPFKTDYSAREDVNNDGATPENLTSALWLESKHGEGSFIGGVFTTQGDWVYFVNPLDRFYLWKIRSGGGSEQPVLREVVGSLNVCGDWIYYRSPAENNALHHVRTDGSGKTLITGDSCANLFVKGDQIYCENAGEGSALYRINVDGSGREYLNSKGTLHFIQGNDIYCSSLDMENLTRINIWTGKEETLLKKQGHIAPRVIEGALYFVTDKKGMVIEQMKPDGSGRKEMLRIDGKAYCYAIKDGLLAVSVRLQEGERILNYRMDTLQDPETLMNDSPEALCLDARGRVYALNADGLYQLDLSSNTSKVVIFGVKIDAYSRDDKLSTEDFVMLVVAEKQGTADPIHYLPGKR